MNPNIIREEIAKHLNEKVKIRVYGMRNKTNTYTGIIHAIYPNIFTLKIGNLEKSFNYRDLITGDIKIKYL